MLYAERVVIPVISNLIQPAKRSRKPVLPTSPSHPGPDVLPVRPCSLSSSRHWRTGQPQGPHSRRLTGQQTGQV